MFHLQGSNFGVPVIRYRPDTLYGKLRGLVRVGGEGRPRRYQVQRDEPRRIELS
jgi:hypothetical protein